MLDVINDELLIRKTTKAKHLMDAVVKEMVISKEIEKKASNYEIDSLEKTKMNKKLTDKSNLAQSIVLPVEKLTIENAIIDVKISTAKSTIRVIKNVRFCTLFYISS